MPNQAIDTSDEHFVEITRRAWAKYDEYLATGNMEDLKAWVELDREKSRILEERQRKAQRQATK